jgi:hypothetical protein
MTVHHDEALLVSGSSTTVFDSHPKALAFFPRLRCAYVVLMCEFLKKIDVYILF